MDKYLIQPHLLIWNKYHTALWSTIKDKNNWTYFRMGYDIKCLNSCIVLMQQNINIHLYLSLPRYGVLKHEVCALCDILTDIITLGREQEALVGVVGKRWGRCRGHWLVAGIPAPVATGWTAVAGWQHLFPNPTGWFWDCGLENSLS